MCGEGNEEGGRVVSCMEGKVREGGGRTIMGSKGSECKRTLMGLMRIMGEMRIMGVA